jgi:hypothetical protein
MVISDRTKGCCSSDLNEPRTLTMTNLLNLTHTTVLGWVATIAMIAAAIGMAVTGLV